MVQSRARLLRLICETFTIRGVARLRRGPPCLRSLWLCFVMCMTVVLCVTVWYLVADFLLYDVAVNVHVSLEAESPFPALTVCHHHPFSKRAYELWNRTDVLSPSAFNQRIRNLTHNFLMQNRLDEAEMFYQYDTVSIYYQNINTEDAVRLGHDPSIFLNCVRRTDKTMQIEDNCTLMEGFRIRQFSHHTFFNCHTFEPKDKESAEATDMIALIVSLGATPDYNKQEQGFLVDLFEMARGLRVVVHEPGTYPDLDREGLHVEPGKLNEINYQPILWRRLDTPNAPCRGEPVDRQSDLASIVDQPLAKSPNPDYAYAYSDLNIPYRYTQSQCIMVRQQRDSIDRCRCQYIYFPRLQLPSEEVPYCGSIDLAGNVSLSQLGERVQCLQAGPINVTLKRRYEAKSCFPRCVYYTYESTISVTTWRAVDWQLHWLRWLNNAFKSMTDDRKRLGTEWNASESEGFQRWLTYYGKENLTKIPSNAISDLNLEGDNFAYVVVKRRSRDVRENKEKLVLSISVLLSRIGGLCSLTIGLTAAFIVELIEFGYLLICHEKRDDSKEPVSVGLSAPDKNTRDELHENLELLVNNSNNTT